jgi:hypothetical protein
LDFPLIVVIGITGKKRRRTYTQKSYKAKLERLCSAKLIHGDQKTTIGHAMVLSKAKGLISLQAPIRYY